MSKELAKAMSEAGISDSDNDARELAESVIEAGQDLDFDVHEAYSAWREEAKSTDETPMTIDGFHEALQFVPAGSENNE